MASNVLVWKDALAKGFKPGLYPYQDVPSGEYDATLDFKIWAKKVMAINCYFTVILTGQKIQLTVFCQEAGRYKLLNSMVDFKACPTEAVYLIKVQADQKKKIRFVSASFARG